MDALTILAIVVGFNGVLNVIILAVVVSNRTEMREFERRLADLEHWRRGPEIGRPAL